jgi:hypothetical protein
MLHTIEMVLRTVTNLACSCVRSILNSETLPISLTSTFMPLISFQVGIRSQCRCKAMKTQSQPKAAHLLLLFILVLLFLLPSPFAAEPEEASMDRLWSTQAPDDRASARDRNLVVSPDQPSMTSLFEWGPKYPETFEINNFSAFFVVVNGWPIVIKYELEEGRTASVRVESTTLDSLRAIFQLQPTGIGHAQTAIFKVGKDWGGDGAPQVFRLSIHGPAAEGRGRTPTNFTIHALGVGDAAVASNRRENAFGWAPSYEATKFENVSYDTQPLSMLITLQVGGVAIDRIILNPPDTFNATRGGNLNFSFRSANDFNGWVASFQRLDVGQNGRARWTVERRMPFPNEPITQGQPVIKSWDGRNGGGHVVPGVYKLMINAWTSANVNRGALTSFSSPPVRVN